MRKIQLKCPMIIQPLARHEQLKEPLLKLIDEETASPTLTEWERVSRSDYTTDPVQKKAYYNLLMPYLLEDIKPILKEIDVEIKDFGIVNYWFQQYHKTDYYDWHRHSHCSWIMLYYLELPKGTPQTQAIDMWDNKTIIKADVKEGDILFMPGMIKHCSPVNDDDQRKTVIAFNTVVF